MSFTNFSSYKNHNQFYLGELQLKTEARLCNTRYPFGEQEIYCNCRRRALASYPPERSSSLWRKKKILRELRKIRLYVRKTDFPMHVIKECGHPPTNLQTQEFKNAGRITTEDEI
jgi:hypothetical protein